MANYSKDIQLFRKATVERLSADCSYHSFDAMRDSCSIAGSYFRDIFRDQGSFLVWAGGSLGRNEYMPESDVDLFLVDGPSDGVETARRLIHGFAKVEVGAYGLDLVQVLISNSLVDGNRVIDGRSLSSPHAGTLSEMILAANTRDRQLANIISEYFYWHYFDFPDKAVDGGLNYKYSGGGSRPLILFNLAYRLDTGRIPSSGGDHPELALSLSYLAAKYELPVTSFEIDLVLVVKNAAAHLFPPGDPHSRRASAPSLLQVYKLCRKRLSGLGLMSFADFLYAYFMARQTVRRSTKIVLERTVVEHFGLQNVKYINQAGTHELLILLKGDLEWPESAYRHSLRSLIAWTLYVRSPAAFPASEVAEILMRHPLRDVWGGIMAVICSKSSDDRLLCNILTWLNENEDGAYLTKLITRSESATSETKAFARRSYLTRENIVQL